MSKKKREMLLYLGLILPAVLGAIGYWLTKEMSFEDSIYNALRLYGLNFEGGIHSNLILEIARWTAPVATAAAVLAVIKKAGVYVKNHFISWLGDSIVVYGDSLAAKEMARSNFNCVNESERFLRNARTQIFLFDDLTNLRFFYQYRDELTVDHEIYIAFDQFALECFDDGEDSNKCGISLKSANVCLFSPNIIKAKNLWKRDDLKRIIHQKVFKDIIRFAFIGDGPLGQAILLYGMQINLYSQNQRISYEIYGDKPVFAARLNSIQTMNGDVICWKEKAQLGELLNDPADVIIISDEMDINEIIDISSMCQTSEIYCYSNEEMRVRKWVNKNLKIHYFGADKIDITLDTVKEDHLYLKAKERHESYLKATGQYEAKEQSEDQKCETEWAKLNWFTRMSNLYSAEYRNVWDDFYTEIDKSTSEEQEYKPGEIEREELFRQLEHIRWCRFHYMNGWKNDSSQRISTMSQDNNIKDQNTDEDIKRGIDKDKNEENRIHKKLVLYNDLNENDRAKNDWQ